MFWFYDPTYILLIPALLLAMYAQYKVQSTFSRYTNVRNRYGYRAFEVARRLLNEAGLYDVNIEMIPGNLTDHYDPKSRVLRLSESVYGSDSMAAIGVAAHETGHAIQHSTGYIPLMLRNTIVPIANFGTTISWPLLIIGFIFGFTQLIDIGIILFSAVVLFQIITLPVEINASRRALALLESNGLFMRDEIYPAKQVLKAAALTYVAAAFVSIMQLIRLFILRDRRD
ncbi:zinc metallopeptidase [Thermoanaerobacterium sp. RBIITD]|uniref:zinc metallopeptidase n=1 Tax=Thermoanaerobacterium sp. RBIITD TaxID=1550240 RepID=UPI000BB92987|nr:zinc metallopeptidase [Thermoanaerobacterium sp. RBIITD]SNX55595.1 hypothetical protein SAMN05660242_3426 [Thermoanaerobacterium sp. RBIITD]